MFPNISSQIGTEAIAVVSGSFLSGAMMNISLMTIPVLLETASQPSQLVDQWVRVYHYGIRVMPGLAIVTCLLYARAAFRKRNARQPWHTIALAGLTTLSMLPFTWTILAPINNTLFATQVGSQAGREVTWDEARGLVTRWTLLHTARTLLPLTGTMIGLLGTLQGL